MNITHEKKYETTSFGEIAYLESGSPDKMPLLFVHGLPTSGYLWRDVVRFLQSDFHCIAPDLMGLGDTRVDPDKVQFHMDAQAEMLIELMEALGHHEFGVVCHDQGGAAAQIMAVTRPDRIAGLALTDCACYDNWPVPLSVLYQDTARIPVLGDLVGRSGLVQFLELHTRLSTFRRNVHNPEHMSEESIREYLRPLTESATSREGFKRFLLAGSPRYTQQVVDDLKHFEKPTMILWAADDHTISPSWGRKLYDDIPGAERFELIPFCGHFWQEDRPSEFASMLGEFFTRHRPQKTAVV